ncbi:MAG: peptidoglycan DD-metalloendopeptidase family protein [Ramlibacter sp.]|nr:peptidoglycan DD-metalloendopeptidase family protein [Cryobacterium sp.]
MPDASDPAEKLLTRRELRERDARARARARREAAAAEPIESVVPAAEPLESLTVPAADESAPEPVSTEAPAPGVERLQAPVSAVTTATAIPFPTRAQLRADQPRERTTRTRRAPASERLAPSARLRATGSSASAGPRAGRASSSNAAHPAGRVRKLAATGFTVAAMAFVALMAISTSLPAEALLSSADVQAAAYAAKSSGQNEPAQTLTMDGGTDTISVQRDGYESQTIAEVAAASGIRMESTFTNNPNGTIQWPFAVGVHIGDQFGFRDCAGCSANHGGQDFNPGIGAPIQSIADGVVSVAEDGEGSLGVHMIIDHMIDGKLVSSVYAHMIHGSMKFKAGDVIKVGQEIGQVGNTGMSTGPHLHFEIRRGGKDGTKVDPLAWLYANTN